MNNMSWLDDLLNAPAKTDADVAAEITAHNARLAALADAARKLICPKCNGSGVLHHYRHIANGQCFRCGGSGQTKE